MIRFGLRLHARSPVSASRDRSATALRILKSIYQFGTAGAGDVEPLHGEWQGCFRIRAGDYCIIFRGVEEGIQIVAVGHRSHIYR